MVKLKPAAVFSSNMVLQREKNVCVFGAAESGRRITVTVDKLNASGSAVAYDGRFEVTLPPMSACDGLTVTVSDGVDSITYENVAVGEVWLAGGQSNMEFELCNCIGGEEAIAAAAQSNVRYYYTNKIAYIDDEFIRQEDATAWCTSDDTENVKHWSAVAYFCASELAERLNVTVGIIGCNWGGTSATAWMSEESIAENVNTAVYMTEYNEKIKNLNMDAYLRERAEYFRYAEEWNRKQSEVYSKNPKAEWSEVIAYAGECKWPGPMGPMHEYRPAGLYHTMLKRVMPYTLRGFLYYQGESDDHRPDSYYTLFCRLIRQWRDDWRDDTLPFVFVQLPMFKNKYDPDYKNWPKIREAQERTWKTVRNTSMICALDCGEFDNIHPRDKKPVGHRMAQTVLRDVYGFDADIYPPMADRVSFVGKCAEVTFAYADVGFDVRSDSCGFELAGRDKVFHPAKAAFDGNKAEVSSDDVAEPLYLRYLWTNYAEVKIFGKNGMPLLPFRSSRNDE